MIFAWIKAYALYIKLAIIGMLVAGSVWATWELRGAGIAQEKQEAVDDAVTEITKQYNQEKEWRAYYQKLSDEKLTTILNRITEIKVEHKTITNNITKEIERDPKFYGQALPEGGRAEWLKARELVQKAVQVQK
jgi:hypothetical protein